MIAWDRLDRRLGLLTCGARPGDLLSLTLSLPALPGGLPASDEWFYWQRPDTGLTLIGMGAAFRIETSGSGRFGALAAGMAGLRAAWRHDDGGSGLPARAFSGFAFAPENLPRQGFPNACLSVPAVLLREEDGQAWVTFSCAATDAEGAPARWRRLFEGQTARHGAPMAGGFVRLPAPLPDLAFLARGRAALSAIERGEARKLVLTRSVRFRSDRDVAPGPVLAALAARNPSCAVWAVAQGDRVFLGASPERLLAVNGPTIGADAIAGTTWLAALADSSSSSHLPRALTDDKNRREHDLVAESVAESLAPLCEEIHVPDAPEIVRLRDLQHLRRRIAGRRKSGIEAFDLLARLHPTPAVGGTPTAGALDWLAAHGDRRGAWYTGGIGWLADDGDADFAIALRCGLLSGRNVTLFAGAGFVAGSDPRQEMAETEAKLAPMLSALRSGCDAPAQAEAA
ncbi:MAG: isochorismate synthase [Candidatus Nitricoxidivorans perseverans]|uniref:isochorismate synthase n=1 Tax=Candidatus Nitricoxidivorans perseverans TaxID=2975601 RepID=A0AA49FKC3_9PROT|nr:MAG: isochorismate synthase [Candidatus Nitricoxidivorans perseverans]